jgi:ring-1,2-phenylacetyl-CoA epoxidase subunit PaaC
VSGEAAAHATIDSVGRLPEDARAALRDLLLALADGKRLLGIRYADWMLGAPTLESGIAASSMAQDEWGHSRLTYALLADFGDDPKRLEHERSSSEYRSCELLDRPLQSWPELIAVALLLDTALSIQYAAMAESCYLPIRNRVQKMLEEERFHFRHAVGWSRRLSRSAGVREEFARDVELVFPFVIRWFGRPDAPSSARLAEFGITNASADELRTRFLSTIGPLADELGIADRLRVRPYGDGWIYSGGFEWEGWEESSRRSSGDGPDQDTLQRVRGDRNRLFLMD